MIKVSTQEEAPKAGLPKWPFITMGVVMCGLVSLAAIAFYA